MPAIRESKSRKPVTAEHPCIRAAIIVLARSDGPMTSVEIYRAAKRRRLLRQSYHSLRSRLSQHSGLEHPAIARAPGSKLGVRGSRGPGWVLTAKGKRIARRPKKRTRARSRRTRRATA